MHVKDQQSAKVESDGPNPFGSLVVVAALGDVRIVGVVRVVVVAYERARRNQLPLHSERGKELTSVVGVGRVERLDSKRANEHLLEDGESLESVLRVEQLGSDSHGNGEVASELVVGAVAPSGSSVHILVDAATSDELGLDVVLGIVLGVCERERSARG